MKRITLTKCMALSLTMLISVTSLWGQSFTVGTLKYDVTGTGEVAVSNADKDGNTGEITIPETVTNAGVTYTVTSVAKDGFKQSKITGVIFPSTLTTINENAFEHADELKSIYIPKTVSNICAYAFRYDKNVETVTFEEGSAIKSIEKESFMELTKLKKLVIPEGVTVIKDFAFERSFGLVELTLPSTLTTVGDGMVKNCGALEVLTIKASTPPATNHPAHDPFRNDFPYNSCVLVVPDGSVSAYANSEIYSKFTHIVSNEVKIDYFTQGDFTYKIIATAEDEVALIDVASSVVDAVIPSTVSYEGKTYKVTALYKDAFNGKIVRTVQIPVGVKSIGDRCFYMCNNLKAIDLPDGLETIGEQAFYETKIKNFVIPNTVTSMGKQCLHNFSAQSVSFSSNCPVIPEEVCSWNKLTEVIVPEGVTTIERFAFGYNSNLTTIVLPSTLTTIGDRIFDECKAITNISVWAEVAPTGTNGELCSQTVYQNATLSVPLGSGESYRQTAPWSNFSNIYETKFYTGNQFEDGAFIYEAVTDETAKVIGYNGSETSVIIPNAAKRNGIYLTIVGIGERAFANSSLKSVEIGSSVNAIESKAFAGITLNAVKAYPTTPPVCADDAFTAETYSGATLFVSMQCKDAYSKAAGWKNFPNIVEEIEVGSAFTIGSLLYTIIDEGCVSVGCSKETLDASKTDHTLTQIIVPETVSYGGIDYTVTAVSARGFKQLGCSDEFAPGENHVKDCIGYIDVVLPETVEEIGEEAFYFAHIKSINMPESLTTLGKSCFMGAKIEGTVTVPGTVTDIPEDALSWAWGINKIVLENGVETIGYNAFMASKMTEITLPASIGSINASFGYMMGLQKVNFEDLEAYLSLNFSSESCSPFQATGARLYCNGEEVKEIDYRKYDFTTASDHLFQGCASLETLIFPKDFTFIGYKTFNSCPNIKDIYCYSETPIVCQSRTQPEFDDQVYQTAILHIPENTYDAYVANTEWQRFRYIEEMDPSGVENVDADSNGISVDGNVISNPQAQDIVVYDTTGRTVYAGNDTVISLGVKGLMIVKCGDAAVKVTL